MTLNVLFVCSRNRLRSPTAEQVFADRPGIEALSAGTDNDADTPLDGELVAWADIVFVMEQAHAQKLRKRYGGSLRARVVCLGIPDDFTFMDPRLVALLEERVTPHLARKPSAGRPQASAKGERTRSHVRDES
jgi:predicted protein tyrosine phosphatase